MLKNQLTKFGLSDKESAIYMTLLGLEVATANEIAKESGIKRSSVYVILEKMKDKGLVGLTEGDGVQKYVATSPDIFLHSIRDEFNKAKQNLDMVSVMIPELKALHKDTKDRPLVRIFEGEEGFLSTVEGMLSSKEGLIRVTTSAKRIMTIMPEYFKDFGHRRIGKGIKMYAIIPENKEARYLMFEEGANLYKVAYMPENKYPFPADFCVYDDNVGYMFMDNGKMMTVLLQSEKIAEIMKNTFDLAWEEAKRLGKAEGDLDI